MKAFCTSLFRFLLVPSCALIITACSGGMLMNNTPTRQLQSITVTPASATAQNTARQVQFTPMGTFNMAPMQAMPQVVWSIGAPAATMPPPTMSMSMTMPTPAAVTINQNGLASCSTFSGTVTIQATAPMDPSMSLMQMGMMTANVTGMAQLTCP